MSNSDTMRDLVLRAAQGDHDAFQELYRLTRQKAYFTALSITKNETDAQDILQESYLKAYQSLGQLECPEHFSAWLNQIVANKAKNYIHQQHPGLFAVYNGEDSMNWQEETDPDFIPDQRLDQAEAKALIAKIVQELPEDQRLVVLMHYFNDLEVADVAKALEVPEGTVKSRLSRARQKLAKMLKEAQSKGIQMYSMAPIPFFVYFIKLIGFEENSASRLPPLIIGATAGGAGAAGAAASSSAKVAAKTAKTASAPAKIAAVAVAAITVIGSLAGLVVYRGGKNKPQPETSAVYGSVSGPARQPASEPEATVQQPETTAQPAKTLSEPAKTTAPPPKTTAPPPKTTAQPPKTTAQPPNTKVLNTTSQLPNTTAQPAKTGPPYVYTTAAKQATESRPTLPWPTWPTWRTTSGATTMTTAATATTTAETTTAIPTTPPLVATYVFDTASRTLMQYTGTATEVTIPATINGITVQHLNDEAFYGSGVTRVVISEGIDCIRSRTFANCAQLREIEVPDSVVWFKDNTCFEGSPNVTIICKEKSEAHKFAQANGIPFRFI